MEYKSSNQRIKIFKNIARALCNNPEIAIEYDENIEGKGLVTKDGKMIKLKPSPHGWPICLFVEISTLLHEICHVNQEHYKAEKITSEMELEAEEFVYEYYPKFRKKRFREKFGIK